MPPMVGGGLWEDAVQKRIPRSATNRMPRTASELAQEHPLDLVVGGLLEHERRTMLGRQHVLLEVREIDVVPESERALHSLFVGQMREDVEERVRVAEC